MNDFRNKQPRGRGSRPASSIDGFSQPRTMSRGSLNTPMNRSGSSRPAPGNKQIDNFKRSDGFVSSNRNRSVQGGGAGRGTIGNSYGSQFEEPVLIDKTPKKQRRGLFRRRKDKKPLSKKKKILRFFLILFIIAALAVGFLAYKGYINLNKVLKGGGGAAALDTNVDPSKLRGEGDGRVNILLLGRGGEGHEAPDLTDTMMLISIDPIAKESSILSIPRDLYVPVEDHGSMKINAVFSTGKTSAQRSGARLSKEAKQKAEEAGFKLVEETIETNLGVPVHYHAIVDFSGFKKAVDSVGGVDLNVPTAVREQMRLDGRNYLLDVKPGQQHMDGFKALAYSRSRYTSARGDFDRSERQRLIILALKQKITSVGTFSNPRKISGLLDTLGGHVSSNFSVNDLQRLYELGKQIDSSKVSSIGLADPPNNYVTTTNVGGQSVVVPTAGNSNFKDIQGYLRNVLKDSFLRNENASIAVLNATSTAGLASKKADELKSFGYNITAVDNAPAKGAEKTVIVDLRNGSKKYTKSYLEKRFGVTSVSTIPDPSIQPGTADFVIILGSDQSNSDF